jgi:hypothetical protein
MTKETLEAELIKGLARLYEDSEIQRSCLASAMRTIEGIKEQGYEWRDFEGLFFPEMVLVMRDDKEFQL